MLPSLEVLAQALNKRLAPDVAPLVAELDDLLLKPRTAVQPLKLQGERAALLAELPTTFAQLLQDWLLDDFSIANIQFGHGEDYLGQLLQQNTRDAWGQAWWAGAPDCPRPVGFWLIAQGDPHALVLGPSGVHALDEDTPALNASTWVCADVPDLLRGLIALYLGLADAAAVMQALGSTHAAFWQALPVMPAKG